MNFAVLNPGGNDPEQHFPDGAGTPNPQVHAPVNYHGFAACLCGGFFRRDQSIPAETKAVLVLLRHDLKASLKAIVALHGAGKMAVVSFKESGAFQVAAVLVNPAKLRLFQEICSEADGAISTTPDLVHVYQAAGAGNVEFIPTPYPVEDPRWDFSVSASDRRGIFIGTREFDVLSRNHLAALLAIRPLAEARQVPVTVFNVDGRHGRKMLEALQFPPNLLRVLEGKRPYPEYLRLIAQHQLVFQLDASTVPGQIAGDALLCRVPCVGGNGTTERLAYPDLCGHGRDAGELLEIATRLLDHSSSASAAVEGSIAKALEQLSFETVARRLEAYFSQLGR